MTEKLYLYPIWVRIWHAINGLLSLALIISGLSMQYTGLGYEFIRFDISVILHNYCGIFISISYIWYFISNIISGNIKHYIFKINGFGLKLKKQFIYYTYGIFKKNDPPYPITIDAKFNPLQQLSYLLIMFVIVPIVIITGWLLFFPQLFELFKTGINGLHITDIIHVISGFMISIFMIIHIYLCTINMDKHNTFKSMIKGWVE